jgi:NAD(P)-dependent dehydrogenase (short-subunit alcohol dehydrogenase family)
MDSVTVITGGAGGMGLATAKAIGYERTVVLCDVRQDRLDGAIATLPSTATSPTQKRSLS